MAGDAGDEIVIIADNDSMMRGLLRTVLDQPGRRIVPCADGVEAVALASRLRATLVLLDLRMPNMDGIEAGRLIRELPHYENVPIIILTVFDDEMEKRRAQQAGVTSFLIKPFSREELLRTLNPMIKARKRAQELERY